MSSKDDFWNMFGSEGKGKGKSKDKNQEEEPLGKKKDVLKSPEQEAEQEIDSDSDSESEEEESEPILAIEYLRKLLKISIGILKLKDKENKKSRRRKENPILTYAKNYLDRLESGKYSKFDTHYDDIESLYERHKRFILSDDTMWISGGNIVLTLGSGVKRSKNRNVKRCELYLSVVFNTASHFFEKYSKAVAEGATGNPENYVKLETRILHYLYGLFEQVAVNADELETLGDMIEKTSEALGINDGTYQEIFDFSAGIGSLFSGKAMEGLNNLIKKVIDGLKSRNVKLPEGLEGDVSAEGIMKVIQGVFNSAKEGAKDGPIKNIIDGFSNCKDSSDIIGLVMSKLQDKELLAGAASELGVDLGDLDKAYEGNRMEQIAEALRAGITSFTGDSSYEDNRSKVVNEDGEINVDAIDF